MECKVAVVDFFDAHNVDHLAAFKHYCNKGRWPQGFMPSNVDLPEFPHIWITGILTKMAMAYIEFDISGQVFGMPPHEDYNTEITSP